MRLIETVFRAIGIGVIVVGALVAIYFSLMEIVAWIEGRKEKPRCPHCGRACGLRDKYCARCGTKLKENK